MAPEEAGETGAWGGVGPRTYAAIAASYPAEYTDLVESCRSDQRSMTEHWLMSGAPRIDDDRTRALHNWLQPRYRLTSTMCRPSGPELRWAISSFLPPQQNLWVRFGSGRWPRLCSKASFATSAVRKPYDFLVTSFTLLLSPSTAPDESSP